VSVEGVGNKDSHTSEEMKPYPREHMQITKPTNARNAKIKNIMICHHLPETFNSAMLCSA